MAASAQPDGYRVAAAHEHGQARHVVCQRATKGSNPAVPRQPIKLQIQRLQGGVLHQRRGQRRCTGITNPRARELQFPQCTVLPQAAREQNGTGVTWRESGIFALRFTSGLFIRWLDEFDRLERAGFLSVAFVALRLLIHVLVPQLNQPDWLTLMVVFVLFAWGFSVRTPMVADHAG